METREFDEYVINYFTGLSTLLTARIVLLFEGRGVGWINFISGDAALPQNGKHVNGGLILNFPESQFGDIVDIFRYEEPLFVSLNTDTGTGAIQTSHEPVGEEELT